MSKHELTFMNKHECTCGSYQSKTYKRAVSKITLGGFTTLKQHTAQPTAPGPRHLNLRSFTLKAAGTHRKRSGEAARSNEKQRETVYIMNEHGLAWTNMD